MTAPLSRDVLNTTGKVALLVSCMSWAGAVYPQAEIDCPPAATASVQAVGQQAEMRLDGALIEQRKRNREADLARFKARLASAQAPREAGAPTTGQ